jgi:mono/diheme cytochrome c family protein
MFMIGVMLLAGRMSAADGRGVYENYCAACHGLDGRGQTPQGRKIKAGNLQESRLTDEEILRRIREGARNKNGVKVMPAFGQELPAGDIDAVLLVVKAFRPPAEPAR